MSKTRYTNNRFFVSKIGVGNNTIIINKTMWKTKLTHATRVFIICNWLLMTMNSSAIFELLIEKVVTGRFTDKKVIDKFTVGLLVGNDHINRIWHHQAWTHSPFLLTNKIVGNQTDGLSISTSTNNYRRHNPREWDCLNKRYLYSVTNDSIIGNCNTLLVTTIMSIMKLFNLWDIQCFFVLPMVEPSVRSNLVKTRVPLSFHFL